MNNLRQIALAFHHYRDVFGTFPSDICDQQGRPLLSWRVRLLPFLEQENLYKQFHLNEPWNSPHNRRLSVRAPIVFLCPWFSDEGITHYLLPRGPTTLYPRNPGGGIRRIRGNPSWTILVVEVGPEAGVIWSRPGDLDYRPETPSAGLGRLHFRQESRGCYAAMADTKLAFIPAGTDDDVLRALFSAQKEEPPRVVLPWFEALFEPLVLQFTVPWLVVNIIAVGGCGWVTGRVLRGKPVSPGEMLWFVFGVGELESVR
jgi:hypothetical protein